MNKVSKYENINSSYRNVRRSRRKIKKIVLVLLSPQVIAHYASVIAIASLYFSAKNWKFSITSLSDWFVSLLSLAVSLYGMWNMRAIFYEYRMKVDYLELHDLLTVARYEAQSSIINICGDLSWLDRDIDSLKDIKNEHPDVQMTIYYDKKKLSERTKKMVLDLQAENAIKLISYPDNMVPPNIRCMITDYSTEDSADCKIFFYPKIDRDNVSQHTKDKFEWQENTKETNPNFYETVVSLISVLDSCKHKRLMIGICGINNSGKTSIVNRCAEILRENFSVKIIKDDFSERAVKGELLHINKEIISEQIAALNCEFDEDIILFDRTPFDNFIYLLEREAKLASLNANYKRKALLISEYQELIKCQMKRFDMVFKVQRKKEDKNCKTKWVSSKERQSLLALYNELGRTFSLKVDNIFEVSGDSLRTDVETKANFLAKQITQKYYTK